MERAQSRALESRLLGSEAAGDEGGNAGLRAPRSAPATQHHGEVRAGAQAVLRPLPPSPTLLGRAEHLPSFFVVHIVVSGNRGSMRSS